MRWFVATLSIAFAACASAPRAADTPVRVITYNIHAGKDAAQQHNLERVAQVIRDAGADIVLLQEVDRGTRRANGEDQLATLARLTEMNSAFAKALDYQGGEYGIGVLSRYPLDSVHVVPLEVSGVQESAGASYESRVGLHVIARLRGSALHVVNTHLDQGAIPAFRQQEMMSLLAHIARTVPADATLIVGGDLNARPDTREITVLGLVFQDAWLSCGDGHPGFSFPAHAPDRRIDYVLLRGTACTNARVIDTQASDHRPVLVTIGRPSRR